MNLSIKSLQSIKTSNKPLLKFFSPIRPLHTITQHDIEKFVLQLRKTAPKGYKVYVRTIRAMFNKFKEWNYIVNNPLTKIKFAKMQSVAPKYLTNEEFEKIILVTESTLIQDFCRVAFDTGMRLNELVHQRWKNVDLIKKVIIVGDEVFTTKTRKQRVVPMSERVYFILDVRYRMLEKKTHLQTPSPEGNLKTTMCLGRVRADPIQGIIFQRSSRRLAVLRE